jgi:hypothetical protein
MFAQAKRDMAAAKEKNARRQAGPNSTVSKRVTPPKNKPTPAAGRPAARPASTGKAARPNGSGRPPKKK